MQPQDIPNVSASRFTRRFVFYEEPAVIAKINELAVQTGHSLSAEIRAALRYWVKAWEDS
jgi:hypothetical protein